MKARLDTVPQDKFPRLYAALHRQNRIDRLVAIGAALASYGVVFIAGLFAGWLT